MRTAKLVTIRMYRLDCPACGEALENAQGRTDWGMDASEVDPGQTTVECPCGETVRLPLQFRGRETA